MRYKIGDRVKVKDLVWYDRNKNCAGDIRCGKDLFIEDMSEYCGQIATITEIFDNEYLLDIDDGYWGWTDDMFEGLVEGEVGLVDNFSSRWVNEFNLPEGYIFKDKNGNVINTTKIVLEKKKEEYPLTYDECYKIIVEMTGGDCNPKGVMGYKARILESLQKLLVYRDAYWKIAGEEMGLDKPWEPNYDSGVNKYGIICMNGVIQKSTPTTNWERHLNKVLDFPTEEMRDAFYDNFKELIEQCKELL